jgi:hypothetical protein
MGMQPYANRSGDSGVVAYEMGRDRIDVQFTNGATYRYDARRPGAEAVAEMQRLARAGRGLSGYIARVVQGNFARRLR